MSSDIGKFHRSKQSAAVLKHAILEQYTKPFASKTGSRSMDNRVAFIDGYAGPGRYDNGDEGSGAMLLRMARELAGFPREVELHLVEQDDATLDRLKAVIAEEGSGVNATAWDGDISAHLSGLLEKVQDIPLFVYLDPCGLIIPMDEIAKIFDRPDGFGAPATEVLINLTAHLRRFGGMLTSKSPVEASLRRIDAVCDGIWWRQTWLDHLPDTNAAELAVVEGYAQRLRERAGSAGSWVIDVRPRADLKPVYYLVFATRHIHGLVTFGESASLGLAQWRRYHAELSADGTLFGDDDTWEASWKASEAELGDGWVGTIAERLTGELAKGVSFRILDRTDEILGDLVGLVRTTHLRAAINKVLAAGKTSTNPRGVKYLYELLLVPL